MLADLGDAQQARAAAGGEGDDIAGLEGEAARRQRELRALARGPGLEQPGLDGAGGVLGLQYEWKIGGGDAAAAAGEAAGFLDGGRIGAGGGDVGELGGGRQVGLLRARQGGERLVGALLDEGVVVERGDAGAGAAVREDDGAVALARVEEEGEFERLQGLAGGQHAVDDEAGDEAGQRAGVVGGKAVVGEQGRDGAVERRAGEAAGDPVAEAPVGAVAPGVGVGGEGRIGARVPGVDEQVVEIDHAAVVDGRTPDWSLRCSGHRRDRSAVWKACR